MVIRKVTHDYSDICNDNGSGNGDYSVWVLGWYWLMVITMSCVMTPGQELHRPNSRDMSLQRRVPMSGRLHRCRLQVQLTISFVLLSSQMSVHFKPVSFI